MLMLVRVEHFVSKRVIGRARAHPLTCRSSLIGYTCTHARIVVIGIGSSSKHRGSNMQARHAPT
jgi:hypothetical protein